MAGTVWPILTAGLKAKASEVESKFDWIEGTIVPMSAGAKTDAAYDLGEAANQWNNIYGVTLYGQVNAKSAFMAYKNTSQTITSAGTFSTVNIDAEHVDYLSEFTTTGNYFKPVLGGLYLMSVKANLLLTTTSQIAEYQAVIQKNGATTEIFDYRDVISSISANGITFAMSMLMLLSTSAQYSVAIKPISTVFTTTVLMVVQSSNTQFSGIKLSNNP